SATSVGELELAFAQHVRTREQSRNLYYSHTSMKQQRSYEFQKQKYTDQICSDERSAFKRTKKSLQGKR
ncbi:hypothetical protein K501DRAFT_191081, partial [Backusella circina FSU 941]